MSTMSQKTEKLYIRFKQQALYIIALVMKAKCIPYFKLCSGPQLSQRICVTFRVKLFHALHTII